jgi:hypothetical protein
LREMSLHIMDIIENGIAAQADLVTLSIVEDRKDNSLRITITDNGRGIPAETLDKVLDPFYTTRKTRDVGLGLSLFRETSKRCDGNFDIISTVGKGTRVEASFRIDHIDLPPMGELSMSLTALIMGNPDVDFDYTHVVDGEIFHLDTRQVKDELEGLEINHPQVIQYIADVMRESLAELNRPEPHTSSEVIEENETPVQ